jgi:hypothetical protein
MNLQWLLKATKVVAIVTCCQLATITTQDECVDNQE